MNEPNSVRMKILRVSYEQLANLLGLPEGDLIDAIGTEVYFSTCEVGIRIGSRRFPPVYEGQPIPEMTADELREHRGGEQYRLMAEGFAAGKIDVDEARQLRAASIGFVPTVQATVFHQGKQYVTELRQLVERYEYPSGIAHGLVEYRCHLGQSNGTFTPGELAVARFDGYEVDMRVLTCGGEMRSNRSPRKVQETIDSPVQADTPIEGKWTPGREWL